MFSPPEAAVQSPPTAPPLAPSALQALLQNSLALLRSIRANRILKGSKVPELEELALTETQLLEQTAALLGVSLTQLVRTGALVCANASSLAIQTLNQNCFAVDKALNSQHRLSTNVNVWESI